MDHFRLQRVQTGFETHPALDPMVTGSKIDHSSPARAEVKNAWSYTFTPYASLCLGACLKAEVTYTASVQKWSILKKGTLNDQKLQGRVGGEGNLHRKLQD
jgi:hypothetical protein